MLRNELNIFDQLINNQAEPAESVWTDLDVALLCRQIRNSWLNAVLSGVPRDGLIPYFCYQLKRVSEVSDTLQFFTAGEKETVQDYLLALIDHLKVYYADYLNLEINVPAAYQTRLMTELTGDIDLIGTAIVQKQISPALRSCIMGCLDEFISPQTHVRFTFCTLDYARYIVARMVLLSGEFPDMEERLLIFLIQHNFNHLSFFNYFRLRVMEGVNNFEDAGQKLDFLRTQRADLIAVPQQETAYAPSWPPVKVMIGSWLDEQIKLAETQKERNRSDIRSSAGAHLTLELSVAYLACLIRLFYEEGVLGKQSLSAVFQFFSTHFNTRRQPMISARSLSKEYYSLDQHTAARVRALLQQMIIRINRNFFPVWVATSTIVGVYLSNR